MVAIKKATTIEQQISLLQERGMVIVDIEKAKEYLLDIGYYRLGFYWFPFEKTYPNLTLRNHYFNAGTTLENAIKLYYFDFDVRNILQKYISRIEINFRTKLIYYASNCYPENSMWYVDSTVLNESFLNGEKYQNTLLGLNIEPVIKRDITIHNTQYAPAWKAVEFMPFGTILEIYRNLKNPKLKCDISLLYGISETSKFCTYMDAIRILRNYSAHGKVLFDLRLPKAIPDGVCGYMAENKTRFAGAYIVFKYFLGKVSPNRVLEMQEDMKRALNQVPDDIVTNIIEKKSGLKENKI